MELKTVAIDNPDQHNLILGHSHFIKTVEDIHEAMVTTVPGATFGLAFCEASDVCLVTAANTAKHLPVHPYTDRFEVRLTHRRERRLRSRVVSDIRLNFECGSLPSNYRSGDASPLISGELQEAPQLGGRSYENLCPLGQTHRSDPRVDIASSLFRLPSLRYPGSQGSCLKT